MSEQSIPYLIQDTGPAIEPLTLTEVKLFLRVTDTAEDTFITSLIAVARQSAEKFMRRSLITQSWILSYDDFAPCKVLLPRGPVQTVDSVKTIARDSTETVISSTTYFLNAGKEILVFDAVPIGHIVEIRYTAGYGAAESDVPEDIRQGMLAHIADLYENRSAELPVRASSLSLYAPYRVVKL